MACPCCSTIAPGLGRLITGGRQPRRRQVLTDENYVWTAKGVDAVKQSAGLFGDPMPGAAFTSEHLLLVARTTPQFANIAFLTSLGHVEAKDATTHLRFLAERWAAQKRYWPAPELLLPAPAPVPAPGRQGVLVNTVLGPVPSRLLGMTLPHEHCFVTSAGLPSVYPEMAPFEEVVPEAVASLRQLKEAGGGAIVDCTTFDLGRDAYWMSRISSESGIHIIASTGLWLDPSRSLYSLDPDKLAELYIRECTVGIQNTGIKAGIIKCAHESGSTWDRGVGFSYMGEMTCRAAARAQKVTGLPITTHTEVEEYVGLAQIGIFEEEGVDLHRVYIGHCNDSTDLEYLTTMLKKGVWLGLDRTGPGMAEPGVTRPEWEERATTIKRLIQAGWGHKIMLSHDWMAYMGFLGPQRGGEEHRAKNPLGFTFILRKVIPRLHEMGVSKEQTDQILYSNPIRFFEGAE